MGSLDVAIKLIGRLVISRLAITRDAGETARNLISLKGLVRVDSMTGQPFFPFVVVVVVVVGLDFYFFLFVHFFLLSLL